MDEKIIIVDKEDNPVGFKERSLVGQNDTYRVSALWVVNSKNQVLLAQRNLSKKHDPGKWGPAVSGTVGEDEDYTDNIVKETQEEIGVDLSKYDFKKIDKIKTEGKHFFFCQWYFLRGDLNIDNLVIQKDEVEKMIWIDKDDFEKKLKLNPEEYTISMAEHFAVLKKY